MPYRSRKEGVRRAAPQTGVVADLVKQFADPYAFVRELVQNGIDAGATRIEVRAEQIAANATVSVRDDGTGMTRAVIEGPLLTLFVSEKEGDSSKIGKYGVGFVSVFAIEPDEVAVETWRSEGSWRVRLFPDHSYELEVVEPREGSGTSVTVLKSMDADGFELHVARTRQALLRWCRHARLPIDFIVQRRGGTASRESIQRDMKVASPVSVTHRVGEDLLVVGVSPAIVGDEDPENSPSFAGFYNHGLTLHETDQPPRQALVNIHLKIDSPHLTHTLSRDNVRHDASYSRLVSQVEELVEGPLREELERALEEQARCQGEHYASLLNAASRAPFRFSARRLPVALVEAIDGEPVRAASKLNVDGRALVAARSSPLTVALAARGIPVAKTFPGIEETLARITERPVSGVDKAFSLIEELDRPSTEDFLHETREALNALGASVGAVVLVRVSGRALPNAAVAIDDSAGPHVIEAEAALRWWRRFGSIDKLALHITHTAVARARRMARRRSSAAAQLLARFLVTEELGELSQRRSDALLELAPRAMERSQ